MGHTNAAAGEATIDTITPHLAAATAPGSAQLTGRLKSLEGIAGERFEHIEQLCTGGMSVLYKARDRQHQRTVALKTPCHLHASAPEWRERLAHEARVLARLEHPNIVQYLGEERFGDVHLIVLEYIDGDNLGTLVRFGALSNTELFTLLAKVCDGIAYAHARGVIHRDIKPANIMVCPDGEPRITDFGIAGLDEADLRTFAGSPAFMAPELFVDGASSTHSDVYALGVTLYHCLTQQYPKRREDGALEALNALRPAAASAIFKRATATTPGARYPDAHAMAAALRRLQAR